MTKTLKKCYEKFDYTACVSKWVKDYFVKTIVSKNKMEQVIQIICDHYNLTTEELLSKKRSNDIAIPRMIAMYICRVYLDENLTKIGIQFGGKNHTTVMHAVDKIKKERISPLLISTIRCIFYGMLLRL